MSIYANSLPLNRAMNPSHLFDILTQKSLEYKFAFRFL